MLLAGPRGRAVQPDRRPRARHLPRAGEPRPRLPRPAHPPERDRDHRRLRGHRRRALQPVRLQLQRRATSLVILGVPYGPLERLWYLGVVLVALAIWYGRNLVRSRPGRALATLRDSEVAAGTNGIDVVRYKAAAFTVSSMYAGLGGVLMALAFGRIVPESFGFLLSRRLPGDGRDRRRRVGRRRRGGRAVRDRAAARAQPLQRLAAAARRAGHRRRRGRGVQPVHLRRGDRRRAAVRA